MSTLSRFSFSSHSSTFSTCFSPLHHEGLRREMQSRGSRERSAFNNCSLVFLSVTLIFSSALNSLIKLETFRGSGASWGVACQAHQCRKAKRPGGPKNTYWQQIQIHHLFCMVHLNSQHSLLEYEVLGGRVRAPVFKVMSVNELSLKYFNLQALANSSSVSGPPAIILQYRDFSVLANLFASCEKCQNQRNTICGNTIFTF